MLEKHLVSLTSIKTDLLYHREVITIKIPDYKNSCSETLCTLEMRIWPKRFYFPLFPGWIIVIQYNSLAYALTIMSHTSNIHVQIGKAHFLLKWFCLLPVRIITLYTFASLKGQGVFILLGFECCGTAALWHCVDCSLQQMMCAYRTPSYRR